MPSGVKRTQRRHGRALRPELLLLLFLGAAPRVAAEERDLWRGQLRGTVGSGVDSNPGRQYDTRQSAQWVLLAYLSGDGAWRRGAFDAEGSYDAAVRAFPSLFPFSTVAQSARLRLGYTPLPWLSIGLEPRAKDRRGGLRDYSDLAASLSLSFFPARRVELSLEGAAHRFVYWPEPGFNFGAPEAGLVVRWGITANHWLVGTAEVGWRRYSAGALGNDSAPLPVRRSDTVVSGSAGYRYRGPFTLGIEYRFSSQRSNSLGQTSIRNRVVASGGVVLPWQLTLLAQGAVQLTRFPDRVFLAQDLFLLDDDENLNSLSVKMSRPIAPWVDAELRYAFQQAALPVNGLHYLRHTLALAFTFRWPVR